MKLDSTHPFLTPFVRHTLDLLRPMDVPGMAFVRMGREGDGGYVMLDDFANVHAAYSIGIGGEVSWDVAMAQRGIDVWQYDHTIAAASQSDPRFHFHCLGVAAAASENGTVRTLEALISENGHAGRDDLILKVDIEGGEWDVFSGIQTKVLEQFSQILIEFHDLHNLNDADMIWRVLATLTHLNRTSQAVHVHANNYGSMVTIGGMTLPDVIEVTFARRSDHAFVPCHRIFPTKLDSPNNAERADIFLGAMGLRV